MNILVVYASRHGATRGIAERIARTLEGRGLDVTLTPAGETDAIGQYDGVVIGSAAYMGHWLKEARTFVRRNVTRLASQPVWLFSSGPIGTDTVDAKGRDVLAAAEPQEFAEFADSIQPRDRRIFYGAYDPDAEPIGLVERFGSWFTHMPAVRKAMPAGDFRDWPQIEAWANGIASELGATPVAATRSA